MSDIKLKNVLKFENSFCVLPFIHEHIDVNNVRKVCCISRDSITLERQKEIKQLMFDNKPVPECVKCLEQEKVKTFSERQLNNKHWLKKYNIDEMPSIFINRKRGESSINLKLIIQSLFGIIKLYFIRINNS